jgi:ABC-type bacteriocin/lantibiotic exporter with double-glycine peptidase domain
VPQLAPTDCGLAALAMVGLRLGKQVSVGELREKAAPGPLGLSLEQLRQLSGAIGLNCQGVRVSAERLGQVSLPVIAHLSDGHYVVLHELGEAGVVVGDPATGIVTWSRAFMAQCYSGSLLLFDRPADI